MITNRKSVCSPRQLETLRWTAGLGAVTATALARHEGLAPASARARLLALERAGLVKRTRLLAERPALYTLTRAGTRAAEARGLEPCRVSVANAPHAIACADAAAALELAYPDHRVMGERVLRREEHEAGMALASAALGVGPDGAPALHRPDLVLWPQGPHERLPVAVEVELTVKAPERLAEICRAWARARCVAGTMYLAGEQVERPLQRAIERARARERIALVPLAALAGEQHGPDEQHHADEPSERCVPGAA
jgi:DNA-binding MarR family transcriptional regulator